jgi:hypothetical protein
VALVGFGFAIVNPRQAIRFVVEHLAIVINVPIIDPTKNKFAGGGRTVGGFVASVAYGKAAHHALILSTIWKTEAACVKSCALHAILPHSAPGIGLKRLGPRAVLA